ncbi:MAG TPA: peptidoglycan DD-metalloendopeptidase family protein [Actinomycetota bacterium]|nr:peptidoglycan DD-metalloendopeptidase family protein [Actinomycetota bacterium]
MIGRQGRAAIAATLLCTVLVPAVASTAGVNARLEKIEARREAIERKIEAGEAEAATLTSQILTLEAQLTALQIEINRLDERIAAIAAEVRTAQAAIDSTQAKIDGIETLATRQAVQLYKAGATDAIETLLNSDSLSELDARIELLGAAAQENTGALIRYGRLRVEIRYQHRELFNKKAELSAERKSLARAKAKRDQAKKEVNEKLAVLNARLKVQRNKEGNLMDESDRIRGDLAAMQARHSVMRLGTSATGYIWPLNGNVTSGYGYRWGRQHTGIDIDGYSGQPIVASKDGRVVLAEYYSGYGQAVVVDHGGGYATLYAHLSRFGTSNGADIEQGEVVGYVGCTGSCTGDHLHFEVRVNGNPQDPMRYLP